MLIGGLEKSLNISLNGRFSAVEALRLRVTGTATLVAMPDTRL
jgi:hypothetical protein